MPVSNERNGTFLGPGSAPLMASNQSWIVVQQLESDSEGCWCPGWEKFRVLLPRPLLQLARRQEVSLGRGSPFELRHASRCPPCIPSVYRRADAFGHSSRPDLSAMMSESLLSPSKITAWLDCDHFLTLTRQVESGGRRATRSPFGSFARLLVDKGVHHESDCLAAFRSEGRTVYEVPERLVGESFAAWVGRIGNPLDTGADVIYQMPLLHDGIRGIADFLVRIEDPADGYCRYEPVDAKLARTDGKPGHVLQLCFYADALDRAHRVDAETCPPVARLGPYGIPGQRSLPPILDPNAVTAGVAARGP